MKTDAVVVAIGHMGQMLSGSKSAPKGQTVFWNGNIYDSKANKLWFGDINVTKMKKAIQELANKLGERLFVTKESPYRFETVTVERLVSDATEPYPCVYVVDPEVTTL